MVAGSEAPHPPLLLPQTVAPLLLPTQTQPIGRATQQTQTQIQTQAQRRERSSPRRQRRQLLRVYERSTPFEWKESSQKRSLRRRNLSCSNRRQLAGAAAAAAAAANGAAAGVGRRRFRAFLCLRHRHRIPRIHLIPPMLRGRRSESAARLGEKGNGEITRKAVALDLLPLRPPPPPRPLQARAAAAATKRGAEGSERTKGRVNAGAAHTIKRATTAASLPYRRCPLCRHLPHPLLRQMEERRVAAMCGPAGAGAPPPASAVAALPQHRNRLAAALRLRLRWVAVSLASITNGSGQRQGLLASASPFPPLLHP